MPRTLGRTSEILRFELLEDVSFRAKNFPAEAQHWADQVGGTIDPGDSWAASAKKGTVFLGNVRFLKVVRPEAKVVAPHIGSYDANTAALRAIWPVKVTS